MAKQFFGRELHRAREPGFAHGTRWHTAGALRRLLAPGVRERAAGRDVVGELVAGLPAEFARWSPLAQDQYLEVKTLLSGYLLSSQGDRMLMGNSVEGRFPFLDPRVVALADSLPASYKLRVLDEKHVLKRAAEGLVPPEILRRPKQPYRAPDALSFVGDDAPAWVAEAAGGAAAAEAGVFAPEAVAQLWAKCRRLRDGAQLSNADNMALVAVLSTHLVYDRLVRRAPEPAGGAPRFTTDVDRVGGP
jgi:asparagine synthase (glutamine-hydrolysing)